MPNMKTLKKWSNPTIVFKKAKKYLGKRATIKISDKKDKKYMVTMPNGHSVHFGAIGYEDYTKHHNKSRRHNYLNRSGKIKGNWKKDKYSANNLARHLLW
jgi:hypothetical protein